MSANSNSYRIGVVFTPLPWVAFASQSFGIYKDWINGATVFDPTMGNGNILAALIEIGLKKGKSFDQLPVHNLFGNELNEELYSEAKQRFQDEYQLDMSSNFTNADFFELPPKAYDIVFGNPPWMNFTNLPSEYKRKLKPSFVEYDLIEDPKKTLLGGSRIDIAALVIQKAIADFLVPNGHAYFFQPLSLLLNDGAHNSFRRYQVKGDHFSIETVYDFNEMTVFANIATRHGLVHYAKNKRIRFPITYWRNIHNEWIERRASPLLSIIGPLSVFNTDAPPPLYNFQPIPLKKDAIPRQGINTSGANAIFFFDVCSEIDDEHYLLNNQVRLPKQFIYPLLVADNFKNANSTSKKWVLLPYSDDGRPLEKEIILKYPSLWKYLKSNKEALNARKGKMIQTWQLRGYWWALLGVGKYNFVKYKVVWEAYGRRTFVPLIFDGNWQVNQSLQAYIPLNNKREAQRIQQALKDPAIENYLHSLKMDGTMNWAQPGKIKKLFRLSD